jgi:hypothetical protein
LIVGEKVRREESQVTVLIALPTQLAIVLAVEFGKFGSDHFQRQFDGLKRIHASSIFNPVARYWFRSTALGDADV